MYFKTFEAYDKSITVKMGKSDEAVTEAFFQLQYMQEVQEDLWRAEVQRLELRGGWASLMTHYKDRWGITTQRFNRFKIGLQRIHDATSESTYKATAKRIGLDAVCLLGTPRFTKTMVGKGLDFLQNNSRKGVGAKATFQYLTTYLKSQFPHAFMVRHKRTCPLCGHKLRETQVLSPKTKITKRKK